MVRLIGADALNACGAIQSVTGNTEGGCFALHQLSTVSLVKCQAPAGGPVTFLTSRELWNRGRDLFLWLSFTIIMLSPLTGSQSLSLGLTSIAFGRDVTQPVHLNCKCYNHVATESDL